MEQQVARLVDKAWDKFQRTPADQRLLIGISGIPGSGKTTLSQMVTTRLNARTATLDPSDPSRAARPPAAFVPMDGYHLTRAQLSAMPDPDTAHARRGAVYTFDGAAFHRLVVSLREPLRADSSPVYAPSFDHAIKDPKANDIAVQPYHRIVIFEGNYLALDKPPWSDAAKLMDELWFVDVDFEVARKRLVRRHVKAGIAKDEIEADKRARENDLVNGKEIVDYRLDVHEVIVSREDDEWVHS
ncbi:Putative phosphoribulokinase/uridine kinase, P-loop containing nucleoside triphosphate hydrolase [Colletotrichum destructivum]|uniref:Phosphoribulokinase/uridine kinase, P-loop containing nucleoside triphosphate hydrolase n=1 Tax=Colletotrichum destructivum TaxID=34406 RepID=A0AAX4IZZ2_9PEZI|nr:Putative phosphoribulokinase/uridine kinase, P-loop containing nucleoside triphosphate hydrolase [Colletotrichum destructivum]